MIVFKFSRLRQFSTVAFSHDMSLIAAGGPAGPVVVWKIASGAELHRFERVVAYTTQSIAFHSQAPWIYVASGFGLMVGGTNTGGERELWRKEEFARNVAIDPTGRRLIGSRHTLRTHEPDKRWLTCLDISQPDAPKPDWELQDSHEPNDAHTELVAFFADGNQIATAEVPNWRLSYDARLTIRAADSGKLVRTFIGPGTPRSTTRGVTAGVRISSPALTGDSMCSMSRPAAETVSPREIVTNNGKKHFTGIAFHPSGRFLAATSNDETVKFYDTLTWEVARTFTWDIGGIRSVAFSRDGTLAAAGSDKGKVVVWDVDL